MPVKETSILMIKPVSQNGNDIGMFDSIKIAINIMPINISHSPNFFNDVPPLATIFEITHQLETPGRFKITDQSDPCPEKSKHKTPA